MSLGGVYLIAYLSQHAYSVLQYYTETVSEMPGPAAIVYPSTQTEGRLRVKLTIEHPA